jgi:hypothetical protein
VVSFTPLYPRHQFDRRLGGSQNRSGLELRPLGRPARSQPLYRLLYPGSHLSNININIIYISQVSPTPTLSSRLMTAMRTTHTAHLIHWKNIDEKNLGCFTPSIYGLPSGRWIKLSLSHGTAWVSVPNTGRLSLKPAPCATNRQQGDSPAVRSGQRASNGRGRTP